MHAQVGANPNGGCWACVGITSIGHIHALWSATARATTLWVSLLSCASRVVVDPKSGDSHVLFPSPGVVLKLHLPSRDVVMQQPRHADFSVQISLHSAPFPLRGCRRCRCCCCGFCDQSLDRYCCRYHRLRHLRRHNGTGTVAGYAAVGSIDSRGRGRGRVHGKGSRYGRAWGSGGYGWRGGLHWKAGRNR